MKRYVRLLRVSHYIKNALILAPLLCSGQLFVHDKLFSGIIAFFAFSLISSVVYIINDIQDVEKDRNHPTKRLRPIASGEISIVRAYILAAAILALATLLNAFIFTPLSTLLLILYLGLNLGYSAGLKTVPILDVVILVSGFLIRMAYGAIIAQISISYWLYLTVLTMTFYMGFGKRRNELKQLKDANTRAVLQTYPIEFLNNTMDVFLTLTIVFYALWSMDEKTVRLYNNQYLVYSVPIVILIILRYSLVIERKSEGDPASVLFNDTILQVLSLSYLLVIFSILYLAKT